MRRLPRLLVSGLVAAVALGPACRSSPPPSQPAASPELELRVKALEGRLAMLERVLGAADGGSERSTLPPDSVERVSRLESRLDKVVGFLEQAVRPELDTSQTYAVPVAPLDPVLGPADAPVTMIEAVEFLCPYCNLLEPTIDRLRAEYPKQLRVVAKYILIHGEPAEAAGLAGCAAARQGKYEAFKKSLWPAIWPKPTSAPVREATEAAALEERAKSVGVELKKYRADIAPGGPCAQWLESTAVDMDRFGVSGTPTVLVNGRVIDERDYAGLKAAIDAELAKVKASGVAPGRYYQDVVLANGRREAVMLSPFE